MRCVSMACRYGCSATWLSPDSGWRDGSAQPRNARGTKLRVERSRIQTRLEHGRIDQAVPDHGGDVGEVLLTPGHEFADCQVVRLEAEAGCAAGSGAAEGDKTALPARREHGGVLGDAVGVVAEGLVKGRARPDRPVDEVGVFV